MNEPNYNLNKLLLNAYKSAHTNQTHQNCQSQVKKIWDSLKQNQKKNPSLDFSVEVSREVQKLKEIKEKRDLIFKKFWGKLPSGQNKTVASEKEFEIAKETIESLNVQNLQNIQNQNDPAPEKDISKAPVQDALKKDIASLIIEIQALEKKKKQDLATEDDIKLIKTKKAELDLKQKKLHVAQQNQERQKNHRVALKKSRNEFSSEYPELAKKLKIRENIGRPRAEEDQKGLLEAIKEIALYGSAAHERRRDETIRTVSTLKELTEALNSRGYEIKENAVYVRLLPKNSRSNEGKRHVKTVPVMLIKATNDHHKAHIDTVFCKSSINYLEELAGILGPNEVIFISQDDKARVPLGKTAANKQTPIVMHMEYRIKLPDHDWVVANAHKLIPSVYAFIAIEKNKMNCGYSGPSYIAIRSGKHSKSTAGTHSIDLNYILEKVDYKEFKTKINEKIKPILILTVDGGPDENPRYQKVVEFGIKHFKKFDLDCLFIATNAPGRSAFNRVERRMAPLSRDLSGVFLKHNYFGNQLDDKGSTTDAELELKNFEHAGETLAEIWNSTIIDGYQVTAKYMTPGTEEDTFVKESAIWRTCHIREGHYFLQIVKCSNRNCCATSRSSYFKLIDQFLPAPIPLNQTETNGLSIDEKGKFASLTLRLSLKNEAFGIENKLPFDKFCPSIKGLINSRICNQYQIYHATLNSLKFHNTICKSQSRALEKKIRHIRIAPKRQREKMAIWATIESKSENLHCDWFDDSDLEDIEDSENNQNIEAIFPTFTLEDRMEVIWEDDK